MPRRGTPRRTNRASGRRRCTRLAASTYTSQPLLGVIRPMKTAVGIGGKGTSGVVTSMALWMTRVGRPFMRPIQSAVAWLFVTMTPRGTCAMLRTRRRNHLGLDTISRRYHTCGTSSHRAMRGLAGTPAVLLTTAAGRRRRNSLHIHQDPRNERTSQPKTALGRRYARRMTGTGPVTTSTPSDLRMPDSLPVYGRSFGRKTTGRHRELETRTRLTATGQRHRVHPTRARTRRRAVDELSRSWSVWSLSCDGGVDHLPHCPRRLLEGSCGHLKSLPAIGQERFVQPAVQAVGGRWVVHLPQTVAARIVTEDKRVLVTPACPDRGHALERAFTRP